MELENIDEIFKKYEKTMQDKLKILKSLIYENKKFDAKEMYELSNLSDFYEERILSYYISQAIFKFSEYVVLKTDK